MNETIGTEQGWNIKNGLIAVAACFIVAEGVLAGFDRQCMPSFNLGILGGQMLLFNTFLVPEAMIVLGIPAFLIAASPTLGVFHRAWLRPAPAFGVFAVLCVILTLTRDSSWPGLAWCAGCAFVGGAVRLYPMVRRFWFPLALIGALVVGAVIFAPGHYGQNNCWP